MLPSSGYFQSVPCPFFKSGLCERPHCHYRHVKPGYPGKSSWSIADDVSFNIDHSPKPDLFSILKRNESAASERDAKGAGRCSYVPTPVDKTLSKPSGILKPSVIKQEKCSSIPEYRPTPIVQLKLNNVDVKPHVVDIDNNFQGTSSRKRKKCDEYDPEEVKYSKKRVSFNLPDEDNENSDSGVITIDSSDDDDDKLSAKFSDDDGDEDVCKIVKVTAETPASVVKKEPEPIQKEISEFSLVDKILIDVSRNDELIKGFKRCQTVSTTSNRSDKSGKVVESSITEGDSDAGHSFSSVLNIDGNVSKVSKCDSEKNDDDNDVDMKEVDAAGESESLKLPSPSSEETHDQNTASVADKQTVDEQKANSSKCEAGKEEKGSFMKSGLAKASDDLKNSKETKNTGSSKAKTLEKEKSKNLSNEKSKFLKGEKSKSSKDGKSKSSSEEMSRSSKDDKSKTSRNSKDEGSRGHKDEKANSNKEKSKHEKSKSSSGGKNTSTKDEKSRVSKDDKSKSLKDSKHKSLKDEKSSSSKCEKSKSSSHTQSSSKSSIISSNSKSTTTKHSHSTTSKESGTKHRSESRSQSKDSGHVKSNKDSNETKDKLEKSRSSGEKSTKSSAVKGTTHSSKVAKPSSKTSEASVRHNREHNSNEKHSKKSISKKIQDGQISSSSVVSSHKNNSLDIDDLQEAGLSNHSRPKNIDISLGSESDYTPSDVDDVYLPGSGSDMDSDTYEDCLKIYKEYNPSNPEHIMDQNKSARSKHSSENEFGTFGKKRLAHKPDLQRKANLKSTWAKDKLNPAQVMHNRYLQLKTMYMKQNAQKDENSFLSSISKSSDGSRKRISAVANSSLMAAVANKKKLSATSSSSSSDASHTVATTIKGAQRVAHIPTVALGPRPIIPVAYGSKVATNIRQRYLNSFINECLKFCVTENQAYDMALEEEKKAYDRSTNKTIYLNIAANALNRLRHRAQDGPPLAVPDEQPAPSRVSSTTSSDRKSKMISHEMMLAGPRAQKLSYSIEKKRRMSTEMVIRGVLLYNSLNDYLLSEEQLVENGYPTPSPVDPKRVVINGIYIKRLPVSKDPFRRICSRCKKTYPVDEDGEYVTPVECDFHWGRMYKRKIAGALESRYFCCQGDNESNGCCIGPGHVFEGSDEHVLTGYVRTMPKTPPPDGYYGVYALDCEMCYTTAGIDLTRVTVIGPDLNVVFETFVKPEHRVLDHNTRFSGITEQDLIGVTTTLRDVQAILQCMFNDKTILIGHSLESDFKALKLIHKTVVDTSVVFPHKLGPPFKKALRTLMVEKCNKIIQNGVNGHDSQEDAAACMELMLTKVKEDLRSLSR